MKQENEKELYADFRAVINFHLPWLCVDDTLWRKSACLSDLIRRWKYQLERNAERDLQAGVAGEVRDDLLYFHITASNSNKYLRSPHL
jgi:hypothetical protein